MTVDVQAGTAGEAGGDSQARGAVVGDRGGAVVRDLRTYVVNIAGGGWGSCRRGAVDGDVQGRAAVAFVASGADVGVAQGHWAFWQWAVGREGAAGGVVGGGGGHTVDVEFGALHTTGQRTDVEARCAVVGGGGGAGGAGDGSGVVLVGGGGLRCCGETGGVDGDVEAPTARAFIARRIGEAVADAGSARAQGGVGCEGATGSIISGGNLDAVDVQVGGGARRYGADVDARRGVVGGARAAVGVLGAAHVVAVAHRSAGCAGGHAVDGDGQCGTLRADVACCVGVGVGELVQAVVDGHGGGEGAGGGIVAGGDGNAIDKEHDAAHTGGQCANVQTWGGIVAAGRRAGGADDGADVVHVVGGSGGGAGGQGVDGERQRGAAGAFVACGVYQAVAERGRSIWHSVDGRQGAAGGVVGRGHWDAVEVETGGCARRQAADHQARGVVVGGRGGAVGVDHRPHVVVVAGGGGAGPDRSDGVDGDRGDRTAAAFVAGCVGEGVADVRITCRQGVSGREGACDGVVGGRHFLSIHVQSGSGARLNGANLDGRRGVVGDHPDRCRSRGRRGAGVDGDRGDWTATAFVAGCVGEGVADARSTFRQGGLGREGACDGVVGGRHFLSVHVQSGSGAGLNGANLDGWGGVVGDCAGWWRTGRGGCYAIDGRNRCAARLCAGAGVDRRDTATDTVGAPARKAAGGYAPPTVRSHCGAGERVALRVFQDNLWSRLPGATNARGVCSLHRRGADGGRRWVCLVRHHRCRSGNACASQQRSRQCQHPHRRGGWRGEMAKRIV